MKKEPAYMTLHGALAELSEPGTSVNVDNLIESTGFAESKVRVNLTALTKIGAAQRVSKGLWIALDMPEGYPKTRGRPRVHNYAELVIDFLGSHGDATLGDLVNGLNEKHAGVSQALVGLMKNSVVGHSGDRGSYKYHLLEKKESAA